MNSHLVRKLRVLAPTEVRHLAPPVRSYKHVPRVQVPMHNAVTVQVLHPDRDVKQDRCLALRGQGGGRDEFLQASVGAQLRENYEGAAAEEAAEDADAGSGSEGSHGRYLEFELVFDAVNVGWVHVSQIDDFRDNHLPLVHDLEEAVRDAGFSSDFERLGVGPRDVVFVDQQSLDSGVHVQRLYLRLIFVFGELVQLVIHGAHDRESLARDGELGATNTCEQRPHTRVNEGVAGRAEAAQQ